MSPTSIAGERSTHSPTTHLGTDAEPAQVMRQLIGTPVELADR